MVAAAGAGPTPIPYKSLTAGSLSEAISFCLTPGAENAANVISTKMKTESGVKTAVQSFHANLPKADMQCDILPDQTAAWTYRGQRSIKMSKMAAGILTENKKIEPADLKL
jgi:hypothetical protein